MRAWRDAFGKANSDALSVSRTDVISAAAAAGSDALHVNRARHQVCTESRTIFFWWQQCLSVLAKTNSKTITGCIEKLLPRACSMVVDSTVKLHGRENRLNRLWLELCDTSYVHVACNFGDKFFSTFKDRCGSNQYDAAHLSSRMPAVAPRKTGVLARLLAGTALSALRRQGSSDAPAADGRFAYDEIPPPGGQSWLHCFQSFLLVGVDKLLLARLGLDCMNDFLWWVEA